MTTRKTNFIAEHFSGVYWEIWTDLTAERIVRDNKPLDLAQIMETVEPELSEEGERRINALMEGFAGFGVSIFGADDSQEVDLSSKCRPPKAHTTKKTN